jgi:hypothetical protein
MDRQFTALRDPQIDPGAFAAALLYHIVRLQVMKSGADLKPAEYDQALQLTIRKRNLKIRGRFIDLRDQDIEYISDLVTEAVNQERISQALLGLAEINRDIERDEIGWIKESSCPPRISGNASF